MGINHLEQLVAEWLQYNGYFVRTGVQVGPRPNGGFEGELDVVAVNLQKKHLIHVECSLDADSTGQRQVKFGAKFSRGRNYIHNVFEGVPLPDTLEQVVVLQFAGGQIRNFGGGRLVTVRELILEIFAGLNGTSPRSGAVPSTMPLLRTLQLAADANGRAPNGNKLLIA